MGLFERLKRPHQRASVKVDEVGVALHRADGIVDTITWFDLYEVSVLTTADGRRPA